MRFSDIPGHAESKRSLIHAVESGHISHAQLFLGEPGSANMGLALAYANYINCEDKQPDDSCGECGSCRKMDRLIHPDFFFVYPVTGGDKAKESTEVKFKSEWREFLPQNHFPVFEDWARYVGEESKQFIISVHESRTITRNLILKSFEAEYRIMVIWLPELMNIAAANMILKVLEEPPPKTIFLLVSNSTDRMLATILSRTQVLRVKPFDDADIRQYLQEQQEVSAEKAGQIALMADGNINQAIKLCAEEGRDHQEFFASWMRMCLKWEFAELVKLSEEFSRFPKEGQKRFWLYALRVLREAMIDIVGEESLLKVSDAQREFVGKFATVLDMAKIERMITDISDAQYHVERNANAKIIFLDTSLQMAEAFRG